MRAVKGKEQEPFEANSKEKLVGSSEGKKTDFANRLLQGQEPDVVEPVEPEERGIVTGIAVLLFFVIDFLLRSLGLYQ